MFINFSFPRTALPEKLGLSISSSGIIEGSIQDGPAIIDSLMKNAAKYVHIISYNRKHTIRGISKYE